MIIPKYFEWKRVCLDTTIVLNLLRAQSPTCTDVVSLFVRKLIEDLASRRDKDGNLSVTFCISSITISEILDQQDNQGKVRKIVNALSSPNVDFVNFDIDVASFLAVKYHSYLVQKALNDSAKNNGWSESDLVNAREWLYKDFMIIASSDYSECDALITNDFKTLYPIAKEVGYACVLAYPECFEVLPKYIHQYDEKAAEALYQTRAKKPQFRSQAARPVHHNGRRPADIQIGVTNDAIEAKEEELKRMPSLPNPPKSPTE